ncbi:MAG: hypothetical protein EPN93_04660 [Spirochaetes bacterium]|nr:MAG: hypothetical protein EPN93_04660 [Spirochaetota bacterium]
MGKMLDIRHNMNYVHRTLGPKISLYIFETRMVIGADTQISLRAERDMKTGRMKAVFPILLACCAIALSSGCSNSDMARVTINLGIPSQAKTYAPSLFDRIVALISLSTRVQAEPPTGLSYQIDTIVISVSSGGAEVVTKTITSDPPSSDWDDGQTSLEIPAGGPYLFTVVAWYTQDGTYKRYGGLSLLDSIAGGAETSLPIQMGLLPIEVSDYTFTLVADTGSYPILQFVPVSQNIKGYIIHRANATYTYDSFYQSYYWSYGAYAKIKTIEAAAYPLPTAFTDTDGVLGTGCLAVGIEVSGYFVVPINEFGEGDDSDEQPAFFDNC